MTEICNFSSGIMDMSLVTSVWECDKYLYFMDKDAKQIFRTYVFDSGDMEIAQKFLEERKKRLLSKVAYPRVLRLSNWTLIMTDVTFVERAEDEKELFLKNKTELIYKLTYKDEEKLNADFKLISEYMLDRDLKMKN